MCNAQVGRLEDRIVGLLIGCAAHCVCPACRSTRKLGPTCQPRMKQVILTAMLENNRWWQLKLSIIFHPQEPSAPDEARFRCGEARRSCIKLGCEQGDLPKSTLYHMRMRSVYSSPSHFLTHSVTSPFGPSTAFIPSTSSQSNNCCSSVLAVNSDPPLPGLLRTISSSVLPLPDAIAFAVDVDSSLSDATLALRMSFGLTFAAAFASCACFLAS